MAVQVNEAPDVASPILRRKPAAKYIGVSVATLHRIMRDDPTFPPAIALGPNSRGFFRDSLNSWLASRAGK
jgi:predicted DNA-binding transcriptional regulator AlpA